MRTATARTATAMLGSVLLFSCAGARQKPKPADTPEAQAAAAKDAEDENKYICTYERGATGTNFPEKVCRLKEDDSTDGAAPAHPNTQSGR